MGALTELMIRQEGDIHAWAFVGREGCELTGIDLAQIERRGTQLDGAS